MEVSRAAVGNRLQHGSWRAHDLTALQNSMQGAVTIGCGLVWACAGRER